MEYRKPLRMSVKRPFLEIKPYEKIADNQPNIMKAWVTLCH